MDPIYQVRQIEPQITQDVYRYLLNNTQFYSQVVNSVLTNMNKNRGGGKTLAWAVSMNPEVLGLTKEDIVKYPAESLAKGIIYKVAEAYSDSVISHTLAGLDPETAQKAAIDNIFNKPLGYSNIPFLSDVNITRTNLPNMTLAQAIANEDTMPLMVNFLQSTDKSGVVDTRYPLMSDYINPMVKNMYVSLLDINPKTGERLDVGSPTGAFISLAASKTNIGNLAIKAYDYISGNSPRFVTDYRQAALEENIYSDPELSLLPKAARTTANIVGYIGSIMENVAVAKGLGMLGLWALNVSKGRLMEYNTATGFVEPFNTSKYIWGTAYDAVTTGIGLAFSQIAGTALSGITGNVEGIKDLNRVLNHFSTNNIIRLGMFPIKNLVANTLVDMGVDYGVHHLTKNFIDYSAEQMRRYDLSGAPDDVIARFATDFAMRSAMVIGSGAYRNFLAKKTAAPTGLYEKSWWTEMFGDTIKKYPNRRAAENAMKFATLAWGLYPGNAKAMHQLMSDPEIKSDYITRVREGRFSFSDYMTFWLATEMRSNQIFKWFGTVTGLPCAEFYYAFFNTKNILKSAYAVTEYTKLEINDMNRAQVLAKSFGQAITDAITIAEQNKGGVRLTQDEFIQVIAPYMSSLKRFDFTHLTRGGKYTAEDIISYIEGQIYRTLDELADKTDNPYATSLKVKEMLKPQVKDGKLVDTGFDDLLANYNDPKLLRDAEVALIDRIKENESPDAPIVKYDEKAIIEIAKIMEWFFKRQEKSVQQMEKRGMVRRTETGDIEATGDPNAKPNILRSWDELMTVVDGNVTIYKVMKDLQPFIESILNKEPISSFGDVLNRLGKASALLMKSKMEGLEWTLNDNTISDENKALAIMRVKGDLKTLSEGFFKYANLSDYQEVQNRVLHLDKILAPYRAKFKTTTIRGIPITDLIIDIKDYEIMRAAKSYTSPLFLADEHTLKLLDLNVETEDLGDKRALYNTLRLLCAVNPRAPLTYEYDNLITMNGKNLNVNSALIEDSWNIMREFANMDAEIRAKFTTEDMDVINSILGIYLFKWVNKRFIETKHNYNLPSTEAGVEKFLENINKFLSDYNIKITDYDVNTGKINIVGDVSTDQAKIDLFDKLWMPMEPDKFLEPLMPTAEDLQEFPRMWDVWENDELKSVDVDDLFNLIKSCFPDFDEAVSYLYYSLYSYYEDNIKNVSTEFVNTLTTEVLNKLKEKAPQIKLVIDSNNKPCLTTLVRHLAMRSLKERTMRVDLEAGKLQEVLGPNISIHNVSFKKNHYAGGVFGNLNILQVSLHNVSTEDLLNINEKITKAGYIVIDQDGSTQDSLYITKKPRTVSELRHIFDQFVSYQKMIFNILDAPELATLSNYIQNHPAYWYSLLGKDNFEQIVKESAAFMDNNEALALLRNANNTYKALQGEANVDNAFKKLANIIYSISKAVSLSNLLPEKPTTTPQAPNRISVFTDEVLDYHFGILNKALEESDKKIEEFRTQNPGQEINLNEVLTPELLKIINTVKSDVTLERDIYKWVNKDKKSISDYSTRIKKDLIDVFNQTDYLSSIIKKFNAIIPSTDNAQLDAIFKEIDDYIDIITNTSKEDIEFQRFYRLLDADTQQEYIKRIQNLKQEMLASYESALRSYDTPGFFKHTWEVAAPGEGKRLAGEGRQLTAEEAIRYVYNAFITEGISPAIAAKDLPKRLSALTAQCVLLHPDLHNAVYSIIIKSMGRTPVIAVADDIITNIGNTNDGTVYVSSKILRALETIFNAGGLTIKSFGSLMKVNFVASDVLPEGVDVLIGSESLKYCSPMLASLIDLSSVRKPTELALWGYKPHNFNLYNVGTDNQREAVFKIFLTGLAKQCDVYDRAGTSTPCSQECNYSGGGQIIGNFKFNTALVAQRAESNNYYSFRHRNNAIRAGLRSSDGGDSSYGRITYEPDYMPGDATNYPQSYNLMNAKLDRYFQSKHLLTIDKTPQEYDLKPEFTGSASIKLLAEMVQKKLHNKALKSYNDTGTNVDPSGKFNTDNFTSLERRAWEAAEHTKERSKGYGTLDNEATTKDGRAMLDYLSSLEDSPLVKLKIDTGDGTEDVFLLLVTRYSIDNEAHYVPVILTRIFDVDHDNSWGISLKAAYVQSGDYDKDAMSSIPMSRESVTRFLVDQLDLPENTKLDDNEILDYLCYHQAKVFDLVQNDFITKFQGNQVNGYSMPPGRFFGLAISQATRMYQGIAAYTAGLSDNYIWDASVLFNKKPTITSQSNKEVYELLKNTDAALIEQLAPENYQVRNKANRNNYVLIQGGPDNKLQSMKVLGGLDTVKTGWIMKTSAGNEVGYVHFRLSYIDYIAVIESKPNTPFIPVKGIYAIPEGTGINDAILRIKEAGGAYTDVLDNSFIKVNIAGTDNLYVARPGQLTKQASATYVDYTKTNGGVDTFRAIIDDSTDDATKISILTRLSEQVEAAASTVLIVSSRSPRISTFNRFGVLCAVPYDFYKNKYNEPNLMNMYQTLSDKYYFELKQKIHKMLGTPLSYELETDQDTNKLIDQITELYDKHIKYVDIANSMLSPGDTLPYSDKEYDEFYNYCVNLVNDPIKLSKAPHNVAIVAHFLTSADDYIHGLRYNMWIDPYNRLHHMTAEDFAELFDERALLPYGEKARIIEQAYTIFNQARFLANNTFIDFRPSALKEAADLMSTRPIRLVGASNKEDLINMIYYTIQSSTSAAGTLVNRTVIRQMLDALGIDVDIATSGAVASSHELANDTLFTPFLNDGKKLKYGMTQRVQTGIFGKLTIKGKEASVESFHNSIIKLLSDTKANDMQRARYKALYSAMTGMVDDITQRDLIYAGYGITSTFLKRFAESIKGDGGLDYKIDINVLKEHPDWFQYTDESIKLIDDRLLSKIGVSIVERNTDSAIGC